MLKYIEFFVLVIFVSIFISCSKKNDNLQDINTTENISDEVNNDCPFEEDWGIIISNKFGKIIEKIFINKESGNEIYYIGIDGPGEGIYFVKNDIFDKKEAFYTKVGI